MKDPLNNIKGNRLNRYVEIKPTVVIETKMVIKEPLVEMSIQSSALKKKRWCVNQEDQLLDK